MKKLFLKLFGFNFQKRSDKIKNCFTATQRKLQAVNEEIAKATAAREAKIIKLQEAHAAETEVAAQNFKVIQKLNEFLA